MYDRAGSAASFLSPSDLSDALFTTHRHLHVSGITPALSPSCAETVAEAIRRARKHGMTVSLDVNYRAKLWTATEAARTLTPLLSSCDILLCSREDADRVFGFTGEASAQASGLWRRFAGTDVIVTAGADGAVGCADDHYVSVPAVSLPSTIERLGSGDAFAAGYLAGFLEGQAMEESLRLGAATAALKRTVPGDILVGARADVNALLLEGAGRFSDRSLHSP